MVSLFVLLRLAGVNHFLFENVEQEGVSRKNFFLVTGKNFFLAPHEQIRIHEGVRTTCLADRWKLVLFILRDQARSKKGPGPRDVAKAAKVTSRIVSPTYRSEYTAEIRQRVWPAAAAAVGVDPDRLAAWLETGEDPALQEQLLDLRKRVLTDPYRVTCRGEEPEHAPNSTGQTDGTYDLRKDADRYIERLGLCLVCARAAQNPKTREWEREMAQRFSASPPPPLRAELRRAVARILASGRALTYAAVANEAGRALRDVRKEWVKAGLREKPRENRKNFARYITITPIFLWAWASVSAAIADESMLRAALGEHEQFFAIDGAQYTLPGRLLTQILDVWERMKRWLQGLAPGRPAALPGGAYA